VSTAKLKKNAVSTAKLKKNAVSTAKLRKDAVTSAKVKAGSLLGADFAAGQLPAGPKGDVGPTFGRSATDLECDVSSTTFVPCVSTGPIALPTAGRVFLTGTAGWDDDGNPAPNSGSCELTIDGTTVGPTVAFGESTDTHTIGESGSVAATGVSEVIPAGSHTFSFECNETSADIFVVDSAISVVLLGGS
jgi:hypothetical protein